MKFSVEKCSILSAGRTNPSRIFCLKDAPLSRAKLQRGLGVLGVLISGVMNSGQKSCKQDTGFYFKERVQRKCCSYF